MNTLRPNLVREAGLEPASREAADFKSAVYTIPPLSHLVGNQGVEPRCHKATDLQSAEVANASRYPIY